MAWDLVLRIIPTIGEHTMGPIIRHLSYAFKYKSKVEKLREEVKKLSAQRESLQLAIEEASRRGEEKANYVTEWEARVEKTIEEAGALIEGHEEEAKKRCLFHLCPNFKSRYKLGRNADQETSGVTKLQEEKGKFGPISYRPPLRQIVKPPVEGYEAPSRAKILKDIMEALMDPNVNMVGVYGMGGVGKTTLAKDLFTQAKQRKSFDDVVMVTISATPVLNKIQGEIADVLGFKFEEETEVGRAYRLHQKLTKKKKLLFILDDLWEPLELEKVGIPSGNDLNGSKIFLTSRSQDVLRDMRSPRNFGLQVLSEEEARSLFEMTVGEVKDANIAKEIVLKCAGYPLSLVTVAGLLRNKDLYAWKDILKQLSRFDNQEIQDKIYSVLELSYSCMVDEELKSLFLLCGLLGQSEISILDLLKYCVGLGLFKHICTVADTRNRLFKLIGDLKSSSLLLENGNERAGVKMHDVVRDAAALIASRSQHAFTIKNDNKLEEWPREDVLSKCTRICLPYCDIRELPEDLKCPEVEFFLFLSEGRYLEIPNSALEGTKKLKVLNFTGIRISLPLSVGFLANLRTLCLHNCQLCDVTTIGQLKRLEILSFRGSMIERLPSEIGELTRLKSLDLSHCSKLSIIPANVISRLSLLEELWMGNSFVHWESEEHKSRSNASLSELEYLSNLTTLEIQIPTAETLPKDLFYKNLERYRIFIGKGWQWHDYDGISLNTLKLKTRTCLPSGIERLLKAAEKLEIGNIKGIRNVLFDLEDEGFQKLKELRIEDASELQYIVDSTKFVHIVFPLLEFLYLQNLTNLQKICHEQPSAGSFSQLKNLSVSNCMRLKHVLSLSLVRGLSQLRTMSVSECHGVEGIIVDENDGGGSVNEVVEFAQLRYLCLRDLPQLRVFVHKVVPGTSEIGVKDESGTEWPLFDKTVAFPRLEAISLSSIPNMEEIWHSQLALGSFSELKSLSIFSCDKLRTLFPAGVSGRFIKLEKLDLSFCSFLEEIYQFQGLHLEDKNATIASELRDLKMQYLPKLKHIWGKDPQEAFTFENLQSIDIANCEVLKYLFPSCIAKSLPQLKELVVQTSGVEEIIAERECVGPAPCFLFSQLTSLKLSNLPHMRTFYPGKHTMECPKLKCLIIYGCDEAEVFLSGTSDAQNTLEKNQPSQSRYRQPILSAEKILLNLEELSIDGMIFKMILQSPFWVELLFKLRSLELCSFEGKLHEVSVFEFCRGLPNLETLVVSDSYLRELVRYKIQNDDKEDTVTLAHRNIRTLKLNLVGGLKHVWKQASQKDPLLSSVETLDLISCWDLITLSSSSSASFRNLTSLNICYCRKIVTLITMSTAKSMTQLVKMRIQDCDSLTEIVAADEELFRDVLKQECVIFNKLKTLELDNLPSLTSFCMSNCTFEFRSLAEVRVNACPNMNIFSTGILDTPKLENIKVKTWISSQDKWRWEGDLNATIRQMFIEMDGFHGLGLLTLSKFPQLIEKWHGLEQLPLNFFLYVWRLVVDQCALLSIAVPSNVLPLLCNITSLVVEKCDSVEEVFDLEGLDVAEGYVGLISQLWLLELKDLPKLRNVWIGDPLGILNFSNLRRMTVHSCGLLTSIFTLAIALRLVKLEFLEVKECAAVEVIIDKGEKEADWDRQTIFPSLGSIKLESLSNLTDFYPGGHVLKCPSLSEVTVVGCPKIPVYASRASRMERDPSTTAGRDEEGSDEKNIDVPTLLFFNGQVEIPRLEKVRIEWNSTINEIWHEIFPAPILFRLEVVELKGFPAERALLPSNFLQSLPNLKELVVRDYFSEKIFPQAVNDVEEKHHDSVTQLNVLLLFNLPKIEHLVGEEYQLVTLFQHLQTLEVTDCGGLKNLVPYSASFQNLKNLNVSKCQGLTSLVIISVARGLVKLERLIVEECETMREIVANEGDGVENDVSFDHLKHLELKSLPYLTSFSSGNYTFNFPWLKNVVVRECPSMKIFAKNVLSTPMLEEVQVAEDEEEWLWEGSLSGTIEKLFTKMNLHDVKED